MEVVSGTVTVRRVRACLITGSIGLFALLFSLLGEGAAAQPTLLADFDGTTVADGEIKSAWRTPWILVRINSVRSTVQQPDLLVQEPEEIQLSYGEYLALRPLLAKADGRLGSLGRVAIQEDPFLNRPKSIVPGIYKVSADKTFRFYAPGANGENYLLVDYKNAMTRNLSDKQLLHWQGRAFPIVRNLLSRPETVPNLVHFTARQQPYAQFKEFYDELKAQGEIEFAEGINSRGEPAQFTVLNLDGAQAARFGKSIGERKVNIVKWMADQLLISPKAPYLELAINGRRAERGERDLLQTEIVAEDQPDIVRNIGHKLAELSRELYYRNKIKFVLLNTGSDRDVRESEWKSLGRYIVFENGFARSALRQEIDAWTGETCARPLGATANVSKAGKK